MSSKTKKDRPFFWSYPILFLFHSCFWNYERLIAFDGFRIIKSEILWYYQSQRSWIWKYLWKKYKNILSLLKMMVRHKIGPVMFIFDVREILITILSLYQSFFLSSSFFFIKIVSISIMVKDVGLLDLSSLQSYLI